MATAFINRFLEDCILDGCDAHSALPTQTRKAREQPDVFDPTAVIPMLPVQATRTATAIRAEADDQDPGRYQLRTIPQ